MGTSWVGIVPLRKRLGSVVLFLVGIIAPRLSSLVFVPSAEASQTNELAAHAPCTPFAKCIYNVLHDVWWSTPAVSFFDSAAGTLTVRTGEEVCIAVISCARGGWG